VFVLPGPPPSPHVRPGRATRAPQRVHRQPAATQEFRFRRRFRGGVVGLLLLRAAAPPGSRDCVPAPAVPAPAPPACGTSCEPARGKDADGGGPGCRGPRLRARRAVPKRGRVCGRAPRPVRRRGRSFGVQRRQLRAASRATVASAARAASAVGAAAGADAVCARAVLRGHDFARLHGRVGRPGVRPPVGARPTSHGEGILILPSLLACGFCRHQCLSAFALACLPGAASPVSLLPIYRRSFFRRLFFTRTWGSCK
jgi:hypothetical protein